MSPTIHAEGALLEVEDLRVAFAVGGREVRAVDGISYAVEPGRTLAIIGESGSGKTVGCRAIMGLLPASIHISGSARLRGTELIGLSDAQLRKHRGSDMAMVFEGILLILFVGIAIDLLIFSPLERWVLRSRGLLVRS